MTADELPTSIAHLTASELGAALAAVHWSSGRVGRVWGLELEDGRHCVVKTRPTGAGVLAKLRAVTEVQRHLASASVPLPVPMAEPVEIDGSVVTFETSIADTGADVRPAGAIHASLQMLLRLVETGPGPAGGSNVLRHVSAWSDSDSQSRAGRLWPVPHDTALLGDSFDGGSRAATELALRAVDVLAPWWRNHARVLGHDDWEAQNLRFAEHDGRTTVVAVFDADALCLIPEPVLAGASALQHVRGLPGVSDAPAVEQVGDWIVAFADARSGRSPQWHRAAWAAAAWGLAYNARCDEVLENPSADSHLATLLGDAPFYAGELADG